MFLHTTCVLLLRQQESNRNTASWQTRILRDLKYRLCKCFFKEGNAFSTFVRLCSLCFRTLWKAKAHVRSPDKVSQVNAWTWSTPLAGETFSLCGGFRNTTQLPFCFCFVERNWGASRGQRSAVKITALSVSKTQTRDRWRLIFNLFRSQDIFQLRSISGTINIAVIPVIILLLLDREGKVCREILFYPAGL